MGGKENATGKEVLGLFACLGIFALLIIIGFALGGSDDETAPPSAPPEPTRLEGTEYPCFEYEGLQACAHEGLSLGADGRPTSFLIIDGWTADAAMPLEAKCDLLADDLASSQRDAADPALTTDTRTVNEMSARYAAAAMAGLGCP